MNKLVFFPATRPSKGAEQDDTPAEIHPGDLVDVRIERTTAWSLQGVAISR
jgi:hypothetical protein